MFYAHRNLRKSQHRSQRTDSQEQELKRYCRQRGWKNPVVYADKISGARTSRPDLNRLMQDICGGRVRRLVVYNLDRLGCSLTHLALILDEINRLKVPLIASSQGIDTSEENPAGNLQLGVLMAVAEFERGIIWERVNAGLTAAMKRGVKFGATCDMEGIFQSRRRLEEQRVGCSGHCPGTKNTTIVGQQSFEHACVDDDCLKHVQGLLTGWLSWRSFGMLRPSMDRETLAFYERTAAQVAARHRTSTNKDTWRRQFQESFPAGGRVLDVGSGSGRDLALLLELGFDAYGLEPSPAMRSEAVGAFPRLKGRVFPQGLPLPEDADLGGPYHAVLCSAVLMHVPEAELFDSAFSLKRVLSEKGKLWISLPAEKPGLDSEHRDETRRLFRPLNPEYLVLLFERLGFQLLRRWEEGDGLGRSTLRWSNYLFELDTSRGRPLDRIEGVLNRDRKTATYKLALFRALSELGTMQHRQAEWLPSGEVALPLRLIAEKWFRYYWPIFEAAEFIPQNNGERPGCAKPVAFRKPQMKIIEAYRDQGGLSQFLVDEAGDQLPEKLRRQYLDALKCIGTTITDGPVVYTSGNMFRRDRGRVVIDAGAWREFCQLGHWIEPAVVLRWAEETNRMAGGQVTVVEVLNRLVVNPTEERNVGAAKEVFDALLEKRCVWSNKALPATYAVDHVIPFSLWHCNDLWNLLPCDSRVNGNKSDRLPERSLMFKRKDAIVFYWEMTQQRHKRRFEHELAKFTATPIVAGNWQNAAFQRLVEAVEITAIQRGAERWQP